MRQIQKNKNKHSRSNAKKAKSLGVAILQTDGLSLASLESYMKTCAKHKISYLLLPEYCFEPFFKMIESAHYSHLPIFHHDKLIGEVQNLVKKYKLEVALPLVLEQSHIDAIESGIYKKGVKAAKSFKKASISPRLHKVIALIGFDEVLIYHQQKLINYPHWNEDAFFANNAAKTIPAKNLANGLRKSSAKSQNLYRAKPLIIERNGFKIGFLFGFELHFDEIVIQYRGVDILMVPSAGTFNSNLRWRDLCKMRAFTNLCFIARANRVGEESVMKFKWKFYGDSFYVNAHGQIEDNLSDYEGLLSFSITKDEIKEARDMWRFI